MRVMVMSWLDTVDQLYEARQAGRYAALAGLLHGENPYCCTECRAQWSQGWHEGYAIRSRVQYSGVVCAGG